MFQPAPFSVILYVLVIMILYNAQKSTSKKINLYRQDARSQKIIVYPLMHFIRIAVCSVCNCRLNGRVNARSLAGFGEALPSTRDKSQYFWGGRELLVALVLV